MTAHFQKREGISYWDYGLTVKCENIGEFPQGHYITWDKKCLSPNIKFLTGIVSQQFHQIFFTNDTYALFDLYLFYLRQNL